MVCCVTHGYIERQVAVVISIAPRDKFGSVRLVFD
ncbi:hypothetical protein CJA_2179 [Cellvibrio japonicus Ueda107]|uniref:Uncharacterized protein n=1 Tax=Cellvibrio japonicus (strain Ueda107) TaxID=498211 RepID=B3PJ69_CELJU|nr:hypothetical protein CJA_2179 [Cellvibrio japonicus Ueda107]